MEIKELVGQGVNQLDELKNSELSFHNANLPVEILLPQRIRLLREHHGLSQQAVSELLSVSRSAYAYYEKGKYHMRLVDIIRLSRLYGVSVDFLLGLKV